MTKENLICKNSEDVLQFWADAVKKISGFDAKSEGVWIITLSNERHFVACNEIRSKVFRSPVLFADEVLSAECLQGVEEFIVFCHRPGVSPKASNEDKQRARAIILAAREKNQELLDLAIHGETNAEFNLGIFSLCHFRREFKAADPFAPKPAKKTKKQLSQ